MIFTVFDDTRRTPSAFYQGEDCCIFGNSLSYSSDGVGGLVPHIHMLSNYT